VATILISFLLFGTVILIMSVGVLMGREPVKGSCGGLANVDGIAQCELCGGSPAKCSEISEQKP
jgi:hypothetical protein